MNVIMVITSYYFDEGWVCFGPMCQNECYGDYDYVVCDSFGRFIEKGKCRNCDLSHAARLLQLALKHRKEIDN